MWHYKPKVTVKSRAKVIAPLPLPRAEYQKDFVTLESTNEFNDLINQSAAWFELPLVGDNSEINIKEYADRRNRQYGLAGSSIVFHSQILIALWDGVDSGLEGGTGQIVKFKLEGIPPPYAGRRNPLDVIDTGPVYHIVTPRVKNPSPKGKWSAHGEHGVCQARYARHGIELISDFARLRFSEQVALIGSDLQPAFWHPDAVLVGCSYGAYFLLHTLADMDPFPGKILLCSPALGALAKGGFYVSRPPRAEKLLKLAESNARFQPLATWRYIPERRTTAVTLCLRHASPLWSGILRCTLHCARR